MVRGADLVLPSLLLLMYIFSRVHSLSSVSASLSMFPDLLLPFPLFSFLPPFVSIVTSAPRSPLRVGSTCVSLLLFFVLHLFIAASPLWLASALARTRFARHPALDRILLFRSYS